MISVLVVDDEPPARAELEYLLRQDPRVGRVSAAASGADALLALRESEVDVVLLDIHMPGLSGLDLAGVLRRFAKPPAIVFVTADESHAVDAYDLAAADYLLKPVRPQRLAQSLGRVIARRPGPETAPGTPPMPRSPGEPASPGSPGAQGDARLAHTAQLRGGPAPLGSADPFEPHAARSDGAAPSIVVGVGGAAVRVLLADITHVTSAGDYARLHTAGGSFLERTTLSELERRWAAQGFMRIHRSALVRLSAVESVHRVGGLPVLRVAGVELPVARRALTRVRASFGLEARSSEAT